MTIYIIRVREEITRGIILFCLKLKISTNPIIQRINKETDWYVRSELTGGTK
jgi:HEAT repeat protein